MRPGLTLGVDEVMARLAGRVPGLRTVGGALDRAALTRPGGLQAATAAGIAAFVVPRGLRGGEARLATGAFDQTVETVVGVVLVWRHVAAAADSPDRRDQVSATVAAVLEAVCGWGPDDATGVFRLVGAGEVAPPPGAPDTFCYALDFALPDTLRTSP